MIGKELGRYRVVEALGEGGMAAVYKGYDQRLNRDVAIKVILHGFEGRAVFLKRFEREARAVAHLTHPNIVPVIDYGTEGDIPYLVMEYLPGGTLKDRMGQPIPWGQAARILAPVARALAYAHGEGILHRDIKPANILVTKSGDLMLSDFGIAKSLGGEAQTDLTGSGVGIGTPAYMAPEQGMGGAVDFRADIYSLGVVFYEMVSGRPPYTADTPMAVMFKHVYEPLPRPQSFNPQVPGAVEQVLYQALAKDPQNRYPAMADFAAALETLAHHPPPTPQAAPTPAAETTLEARQTPWDEGSPATPPPEESAQAPTSTGQAAGSTTPPPVDSPPSPGPDSPAPGTGGPRSQAAISQSLPAGKRPKWFLWLVIVCAACILGSIGCWVAWRISVKQDQELRQTLTQTAEAREAEASSQGSAFTATPLPTETEAPPDPLAAIAFFSYRSEDHRDLYRVEQDGKGTEMLLEGLDSRMTWFLSPDGKRILYTSDLGGNWEMWVASVGPYNLQRLIDDPTSSFFPDWSPDSQRIAFSARLENSVDIWLMDLDGSDLQQLTEDATEENFPDWSPDGRQIAYQRYTENQGDIWVMDADGERQHALTQDNANQLYHVWSPDSQQIAFSSDVGGEVQIWVVNVDGTGLKQITSGEGVGAPFSWSPDGRFIAYEQESGGNADIWVSGVGGSSPHRLETGPGDEFSPAWSPGGGAIVFHSNRDGNVDLWLIQPDGEGLRQLTDSPEGDYFAGWVP